MPFSLGSMQPMGNMASCYDDGVHYPPEKINNVPLTKIDYKAEETRQGYYVADCERHGKATCLYCRSSDTTFGCYNEEWKSGCYNPVWKYYPNQ